MAAIKSVRVAAAAAADREEGAERKGSAASECSADACFDHMCRLRLTLAPIAFLVPLPKIPRAHCSGRHADDGAQCGAASGSQQRIDRRSRLLALHPQHHLGIPTVVVWLHAPIQHAPRQLSPLVVELNATAGQEARDRSSGRFGATIGRAAGRLSDAAQPITQPTSASLDRSANRI